MQAKYTKEYLKEIEDFQYPRDLEKSINAFLTFSATQGEAYDRIATSSVGGYVGIRQQMIDKVMNSTWGESKEFNLLGDWKKKLLMNFIEQTGLNAYKQWIKDGKNEPLDDLIKETVSLVKGGVDNFLK